MRDQFDYFVTERSENHARILLAAREGSGVAQVTGVVRGPFCDFSRTLTADSSINRGMSDGTFESLIVEPCYWTSSLPFWYDLRLTVTHKDGTTREGVFPVGLKRFYCDRRNFLLEGKRVVLRGVQVDSSGAEQLDAARKHETALIVKHADEGLCATASRLGVPLIVDLRGAESATSSGWDWYPAVMLVLIAEEQVDTVKLRSVYTAICVGAGSEPPTGPCDSYAIELQSGERPPFWAANCDKPVIVIRKDSEAEIRTARTGCDKLQAELAPEFDLAGYFV
jgi:hypothetical protein